MNKTTKELENILKNTHPDTLDKYIDNEKDNMIENDFEAYFKDCLKKKNLFLHTVFLRSDISEGYGYKLLSGQKHTNNRNLIIKLCYVSYFDINETNRALMLYGMAPLYARIKNDAAIISLFNNKNRDSYEFDNFIKNELPLC